MTVLTSLRVGAVLMLGMGLWLGYTIGYHRALDDHEVQSARQVEMCIKSHQNPKRWDMYHSILIQGALHGGASEKE